MQQQRALLIIKEVGRFSCIPPWSYCLLQEIARVVCGEEEALETDTNSGFCLTNVPGQLA